MKRIFALVLSEMRLLPELVEKQFLITYSTNHRIKSLSNCPMAISGCGSPITNGSNKPTLMILMMRDATHHTNCILTIAIEDDTTHYASNFAAPESNEFPNVHVWMNHSWRPIPTCNKSTSAGVTRIQWVKIPAVNVCPDHLVLSIVRWSKFVKFIFTQNCCDYIYNLGMGIANLICENNIGIIKLTGHKLSTCGKLVLLVRELLGYVLLIRSAGMRFSRLVIVFQIRNNWFKPRYHGCRIIFSI